MMGKMNIQEVLDIVDEFGQPTGAIVSRDDAHERGVRHRTAHSHPFPLFPQYISPELQQVRPGDPIGIRGTGGIQAE